MLSLPIISSIHVRIYIYTPTLIGHRRWWMVATAIRIFLCYWHFSWWNVASQHQAAKSQPQRQHVHPSFGGMLLQPGGSDSRNPKPNSSQFQHIPTNGLSSTSLKTKKKNHYTQIPLIYHFTNIRSDHPNECLTWLGQTLAIDTFCWPADSTLQHQWFCNIRTARHARWQSGRCTNAEIATCQSHHEHCSWDHVRLIALICN